jgi:hypothetical protein
VESQTAVNNWREWGVHRHEVIPKVS